jgi:hypothetical protein
MGNKSSAVLDRTITSAGIDYLTCSSTNPRTIKEYEHAFATSAMDYRRAGTSPRRGGFHGYAGMRLPDTSILTRDNRTLYIASGSGAQRGWKLARTGDNCSRIDIQVTARVPGGDVSEYINTQHNGVRSARTLRGHTQHTRYEVVDGVGQTLYIGKRSSDLFIRIYDKFAESGDEAYKGCVRLEIEYKGKRSAAIWRALADGSLSLRAMMAMLLRDLEERGVDVSWIDLDRQDVVRPKPIPLKEERTLGWWASQVAPSVARLSAERGWYTAFRVLFHEALTEWDKTAIMNTMSLQWGN